MRNISRWTLNLKPKEKDLQAERELHLDLLLLLRKLTLGSQLLHSRKLSEWWLEHLLEERLIIFQILKRMWLSVDCFLLEKTIEICLDTRKYVNKREKLISVMESVFFTCEKIFVTLIVRWMNMSRGDPD